MSEKITQRHLQRKALLYVRQSTQAQVANNEESRRLQYAMRDRLASLGWREVEVIDDDLGRSAGGHVDRPGFQRLVADVSLGLVGVVAARELSRFARNSRDWQRLLELCRYVDTLLIDQDTVYDVRGSNDRLLLGLKGSLNEYELDLLRLRAHEARNEKAKRGEFFAKIAVGYRKSEDGQLEKTPDLRVQQTIAMIFTRFLELGSVRQVLASLAESGLSLPSNVNHRGVVRWKPAHYGLLHQILTNPIYAGAYVYGRTHAQTAIVGDEVRSRAVRVGRDEWKVLLREHHEGYIDWPTFERIQQMISRNAQIRSSGPGAARTGNALLAGLLRCRRCGDRLGVTYSGARHDVHRYVCSRGHKERAAAPCIGFSGLDVDARITREVLDVVRPAAIEASLRAGVEQGRAADDEVSALSLELEAARYSADRAARQFDVVDPENRLVASELERRWNEALCRVREIESRIDQRRAAIMRDATSSPTAETFAALAADLHRVWHAPNADAQLKKRILRTLIEEVVADVEADAKQIVLLLHWKGGAHTEVRVRKRARGENSTQTAPDIVEAIRVMALVCSDESIAAFLSRGGVRTAKGNPWTQALVASFRSKRGIPAYNETRRHDEGWLTLQDAVALVRVAPNTLRDAVASGELPALHPLNKGPWIFRRDDLLRRWPATDCTTEETRSRRGDEGAERAPRQLSLARPRR